MEESGFSFDDFSIEMQDFEVRKVRKYDRIWHIGPGGSVSSAVIANNGIVYFGCRDHFFYALNAENGDIVWRFEALNQIPGGVPIFKDGVVYFGSTDYNFYAVDANTGRLIWKFPARAEIGCSGACADDKMIYFGSRDNFIYALDIKTGELKWKFKTQDCVVSMPVLYKDKLLIGSFDQNFYCLNKRNGNLIWKFETQGEIFNYTPFLVHDGKVHFGSFDNFLRAVDVNSGSLIWKFSTGNYGMSGGSILHKDVLYQGCRDGNLYALNLDGKLLWKFETREIVIPVLVHDDKIYFGSGDQNLYCLDLQGREQWKFHTQGDVIGKFAIWGNNIYFGSYDCNLYAVNLLTRDLVWRFKTSGSPCYSPPPFESFEIRVKTEIEPKVEEKKKKYELDLGEKGEERGSFYKSRVTYQVSDRYQKKGKYQTEDEI